MSVGSTYFQVVKVKTVEDKRIITTTDKVGVDGKVIDGRDDAWTLTSDTVKIGVNTDDKEKSDNNTVVAYTKTFGDDYANAAIFYEVKSGYNELKAIFIDSDNKLQSYVQDASASAQGNAGAAYTVVAPTVSGVAGVTATADKTSAVAGETVTVAVAANSVANQVTVSATNGTVSPATATTVAAGHTYTFTVVVGSAAPVITVTAATV